MVQFGLLLATASLGQRLPLLLMAFSYEMAFYNPTYDPRTWIQGASLRTVLSSRLTGAPRRGGPPALAARGFDIATNSSVAVPEDTLSTFTSLWKILENHDFQRENVCFLFYGHSS